MTERTTHNSRVLSFNMSIGFLLTHPILTSKYIFHSTSTTYFFKTTVEMAYALLEMAVAALEVLWLNNPCMFLEKRDFSSLCVN